jgi:radical SAM superfamily enzyme YgiQ (UPF0313 family)
VEPNRSARSQVSRRVLIVDLNNFARYPSIPVGYLSAVCRNAGYDVSVFSPLMLGIGGVVRERPTRWYSLTAARLNYRAAVSPLRLIRSVRKRAAMLRAPKLKKEQRRVVDEFRRQLAENRPDVVLVSSYLMYLEHSTEICAACVEHDVPVLVGGPYFAQPEVVAEWVAIPGVTAIVGGEVELELPAILATVLAKGDLLQHPGLWLPGPNGKPVGGARPPLTQLDDVPFPDYRDFPWAKYPNRIIPVLTGRGCGWGVCTFCSDVTSTAGRTFRSRDPRKVLDEIAHHHEQHGASLFAFTDLKLNSDLVVWQAILSGMQRAAPGSRWIGSVHVDAVGRPRNGLSHDELAQAAESGCVRLTTGLENGSQRILDAMKKGTNVAATGHFVAAAAAAGISVRCTMIVGYPGETASDIDASADYIEQHRGSIERVSLNRFSLMTGTGIHRSIENKSQPHPDFELLAANHPLAQIEYRHTPANQPAYHKSVMRLLGEVHVINREPLSQRARDFEGVM